MSEEYDLKKSEEGIGQLYPVLKDKNGNVIDGFHRLEDDPNWRTETLEHIDSEEKLLIARAVSNWNRRQISREEKEEWINGLARIYSEQGYKIKGKKSIRIDENNTTSNEILARIVSVTGLNIRTVGEYLSSKFKQMEQSRTQERQPVISASEQIAHKLGEEYVERFRKEVLEEEKLSPEEKAEREVEKQRRKEEQKRRRAEKKRKKEEKRKQREEEIRRQAEEEAREELMNNPAFQKQVIQKVQKQKNVTPTNLPIGNEKEESLRANSIDVALDSFEKAVVNIDPKRFDADPMILTKHAFNALKGLIQRYDFVCPICGNAHIVRECGHDL